MIPSQELLMQQIFQIYLKSVIWEEHFEHIWEEHFEHIRAHLRGTHADQTARQLAQLTIQHWSLEREFGKHPKSDSDLLAEMNGSLYFFWSNCKTIKIKCMNYLTFDTIHFNPNKLMKHCSVW